MNETVTVSVTTKGGVDPATAARLEAHLRRLADQVDLPILSASGTIVRHHDPARQRPVLASATVDLNGHWERASVEADEEIESVDLLDAKVRRIVKRYNDRRQRKGRLHAPAGEGHWRHGDQPAPRSPWQEIPDDERQIVQRALHGPVRRTIAEADFDLEVLGQFFTLFVDDATDLDSLLCRNDDGSLELIQLDQVDQSDPPVVRLEVSEAIEQLTHAGDQLVFFRDAQTGRGTVVYHRDDGHLGLIRLG